MKKHAFNLSSVVAPDCSAQTMKFNLSRSYSTNRTALDDFDLARLSRHALRVYLDAHINARQSNRFIAPRFGRYTLVGHNGEVIFRSAPVLLGEENIERLLSPVTLTSSDRQTFYKQTVSYPTWQLQLAVDPDMIDNDLRDSLDHIDIELTRAFHPYVGRQFVDVELSDNYRSPFVKFKASYSERILAVRDSRVADNIAAFDDCWLKISTVHADQLSDTNITIRCSLTDDPLTSADIIDNLLTNLPSCLPVQKISSPCEEGRGEASPLCGDRGGLSSPPPCGESRDVTSPLRGDRGGLLPPLWGGLGRGFLVRQDNAKHSRGRSPWRQASSATSTISASPDTSELSDSSDKSPPFSHLKIFPLLRRGLGGG